MIVSLFLKLFGLSLGKAIKVFHILRLSSLAITEHQSQIWCASFSRSKPIDSAVSGEDAMPPTGEDDAANTSQGYI
jgi:hypothetical protein